MKQEFNYIWRWKPTPLRIIDKYGMPCRILARGKMNSCLVEFEDGSKYVTSRNGVKKK